MIATLPVSAGPVYVFLAIDHGAQFIAEAARTSVAAVTATLAFVAAHAFAAQRFSTPLSLAAATLSWLSVALLLQMRDWSFVEAAALLAVSFALAIRGMRHLIVAVPVPSMARGRYDLALRAALVACVVIATTFAGNALGPAAAGILATYPVVFTSLILILQPRYGGPFTASMLVGGLKGLIGFAVAIGVLHLAAAGMGSAWALAIALAVAVGWNCALYLLRTRPVSAGGD